MKEDEIIKSQVFKALNQLIDQKALELRQLTHHATLEMIRLLEPQTHPHTISTRVHPEDEKTVELHLSTRSLNHLCRTNDKIQEVEREIGSLQRYKCRLLNDYDFTKGDDFEQRHVFKSD